MGKKLTRLKRGFKKVAKETRKDFNKIKAQVPAAKENVKKMHSTLKKAHVEIQKFQKSLPKVDDDYWERMGGDNSFFGAFDEPPKKKKKKRSTKKKVVYYY